MWGATRTSKLERDINVLLTAIPRGILLPDLRQIVKGSRVLGDAAHSHELNVLRVKVCFDIVTRHAGAEGFGI